MNLVRDYPEHSTCYPYELVQVIAAYVNLNSPSPAKACLKYPGLTAYPEHAWNIIDLLHKQRDEFAGPLLMCAYCTGKHDLLRSYVKHIFYPGISVVVFVHMGFNGLEKLFSYIVFFLI